MQRMNKRIQKLAEQAGIYKLNLSDETEYWIMEKFAQLILKECLVQVNEVYTSLDNKDKRVGAAAVGLTIAAHFGVE
jgi:hypothetical protein